MLKLTYTYGVIADGVLDGSQNNGNIESQTITVPTIGTTTGFTAKQNYKYDLLNRLETAWETGAGGTQNWKQTYSYDRFGNRRFSYTSGATTVPVEPTTPQHISIYNPEISPTNNNRLVGYVYDAAGNIKTDSQDRTFAYDAENHQIIYNDGATINGGQNSASYSYDGDGRRIKKQIGGSMATTIFVYNILGQLVAEYTDASESRTQQTNYLTGDLGSTRVVTGSDQLPKERHDYLPFGEDIGAQWGRTGGQKFDKHVVRQTFGTYERDSETGLDYAQARYYSSIHGRFTTSDPLIASAKASSPQTWNRYVYCGNNPLNRLDPSGLDWWYKSGESSYDPEWHDTDPGEGYRRWTEGGSYVFHSSSGKWWALNCISHDLI